MFLGDSINRDGTPFMVAKLRSEPSACRNWLMNKQTIKHMVFFS